MVGGNLLKYILDPDRPYFIVFTVLPNYLLQSSLEYHFFDQLS